jgi:UDP-glucuronate decarboxylase
MVTGGAGFLGSSLCERLVDEGRHVVCVDNLYTGRMDNIAHLLGSGQFEIRQHDVTEPIDVEDVTEIYHLACPASPPQYQRDPVSTLRTSVWGTFNLLELAKKRGAKLLLASTSEVYGDPLIHPQTESYFGNVNTLGPRACYDEGKRCAETLCMDFHRQYGVNVRIVRIFNTYGPRMNRDDGRVVSNFIVQALRGEPLTIYGDGGQTRSFCYVDDLIEGIVRMMRGPDDFAGPVNLGNPGEFTVRELAEMVLQMTGSDSTITTLPLPQDDPTRRKPDISLAGRMLHWQPSVSLEEGLRRTIDGFRQQMACDGR